MSVQEQKATTAGQSSECVATDHVWHFVKENSDSEWVIVDFARRGVLVRLRDRMFGPLDIDKLGWIGKLERSKWVTHGWDRKWACAKCRKVIWDYTPNTADPSGSAPDSAFNASSQSPA